MSLAQRIADDTKAALLGGNRFAGETLRNLRAAILNEEVAAGKRDEGLTDDEIETVIAREVKKRNESAKMYRDNGRLDLAEPEEQELEILQQYLPQQLSEDQIRTEVKAVIVDSGAQGMAAMGQVIGAVKSQLGNSADGAVIARIVKEELSS